MEVSALLITQVDLVVWEDFESHYQGCRFCACATVYVNYFVFSLYKETKKRYLSLEAITAQNIHQV